MKLTPNSVSRPLIAIGSVLLSTLTQQPALCQQDITTEGGGLFMEEDVSQRKDPPKQHVVLPQDLSNVGISTDPQGHIIPRLRASSQAVQPMYSGLQMYNELPVAPYPGGTYLWNPTGQATYGANGLQGWLPYGAYPMYSGTVGFPQWSGYGVYGYPRIANYGYPNFYTSPYGMPYASNGVNLRLGGLSVNLAPRYSPYYGYNQSWLPAPFGAPIATPFGGTFNQTQTFQGKIFGPFGL